MIYFRSVVFIEVDVMHFVNLSGLTLYFGEAIGLPWGQGDNGYYVELRGVLLEEIYIFCTSQGI